MPLELHIVLTDDGQLQINGCINNPVQAYGLLEMAKDGVRNHLAQQQKVQPVAPDIAAMIIGGRRQ